MRRPSRRTVLAGVLALEAVGAAVLGMAIWHTDHRPVPHVSWAITGRPLSGTSPSDGTPTAATSAAAVVLAAPPLRLTVPVVGIDASVAPYTSADAAAGRDGATGQACLVAGAITCVDPPSAHSVVWQVGGVAGVAFGSEPGTDTTGTVYLYGHAATGGSAVFNDIPRLAPGDQATVTTANGSLVYGVQRVVTMSKTAFASSPEATDQVPGRLLLISCDHGGGATLVHGGYSTSNTVVVLQLESS